MVSGHSQLTIHREISPIISDRYRRKCPRSESRYAGAAIENMRRIDVFLIGLALFLGGGAIYVGLQAVGMDGLDAGIWAQVILVIGLVGWLLTYLVRALTKTMTYNQQLRDYEDAVLQKRLDEMTPEQLEQLQAEIEQEKKAQSSTD